MTQKSFDGNAVPAKLTAGVNSVALSISVDVTTGWPTTPTSPFVLTIGKDTASEEKVLCDSQSGGTVVINAAGRGYDGTTATAHVAGEDVEHTVDASTLTELMAHVYDTTRDDHGQYMKTDGTRSFTGVSAICAAPTASAPGDTSVTGAAVTLANSAHKHAREGFAAPVASAVGDTQSTGAATTVANSAHRHAREAFGSPTSLGVANGDGSGTTVPHADHIHKGGLIIAATPAAAVSAGLVVAEGDTVAGTTADRVETYSGSAWVRTGHWSSTGRTGCTLERSALSIAASYAAIVWSSETTDTDGFIVVNGANYLVTVPAGLGGLYSLSLAGTWTTVFADRSFFEIQVNATLYRFPSTGEDAGGSGIVVPLAAGDTVAAAVFHANASNRTYSAHFDMQRLGA